MQESGRAEIIPLVCTSTLWASVLCFLILSPLRAHRPGDCNAKAWRMAATAFADWYSR